MPTAPATVGVVAEAGRGKAKAQDCDQAREAGEVLHKTGRFVFRRMARDFLQRIFVNF
jgi:hypothetical protein